MHLARLVELMNAAPRCNAYSRRSGKPCRAPAMANGRCRMHGGKSPGKPGNKNALKHGHYSHETILLRKAISTLIGRTNTTIAELLKG